MTKNRVEAFTDGVIAIIITIMVLELQIPETLSGPDMIQLGSDLLIYLMSYIYIGIYWSNHHHLFSTVERVSGKILINNLALLFFLSLIPFATKWLAADFGRISLEFYGLCLMASAISYFMLVKGLIANGNEVTKKIFDNSRFKKEIISMMIYLSGLILAFVFYPLSVVSYIAVAIIWIIPDKKIEKHLELNY